MPTRFFSTVWSVLCILVFLAGCGKREETLTAVERATREQIFLAGNGAEPQDLDPHVVTGVTEHKIISAIFEGLVSEDPVDLHPVPAVAERWEISEDGLTYTFHLRADACWSNGDAVVASDFVGSWKRILTPALGAQYAYQLHCVEGAAEYSRGELKDFSKVGFSAPDERTVVVRLKSRTPFLLQVMASHYAWWPVHLKTVERFGGLEKKGTGWTRPENFVGNGPFVLREWKPNERISVTRSETYWDRAKVRLREIQFFPVESSDVAERMYRAGQLHLVDEVPSAKIEIWREKNSGELRMEPLLGVYFFSLNTKRPPLDDVRVRRALALAIDREAIVERVTRGGQNPTRRFTPAGTAGYTSTMEIRGDLAEARRLLAEAGFPEGKGFPNLELFFNTSENHAAIAQAVQDMWRRNLGIEIALTNQEWKVYLDAKKRRAYDILRAGWLADYPDPHNFLDIWQSGGGNNDTGWSNAEYDALLSVALAAKTEAERFAIYDRMETILLTEVPVIPVYNYTRVKLLHPSVRGYHPTVLDSHPYKYLWLEAR